MVMTQQGKTVALTALVERRAKQPTQIDNAALVAGSDMYFYCISCGHLADVKPENYLSRPKQLCAECQALKDLGWLE